MLKDTKSLGNNKAPACESRGLVHKKRCANFDTPPFLIVKVWDIYISCRYILLQKKLDLKVVKLYPLHSQGSFVFVHSIRIISLKMSDSTKERFYFIQNKFIWNYFYTIGDYNKYLNTIRRLIGRCNRYFRR